LLHSSGLPAETVPYVCLTVPYVCLRFPAIFDIRICRQVSDSYSHKKNVSCKYVYSSLVLSGISETSEYQYNVHSVTAYTRRYLNLNVTGTLRFRFAQRCRLLGHDAVQIDKQKPTFRNACCFQVQNSPRKETSSFRVATIVKSCKLQSIKK
jgi:hypothetical protein